METISVKVPVTVKAKLTEKLKKSIIDGLQNNLQQVALELQQIDIQEKRAISEQGMGDLQRIGVIRQQFGAERAKRQEFKVQA